MYTAISENVQYVELFLVCIHTILYSIHEALQDASKVSRPSESCVLCCCVIDTKCTHSTFDLFLLAYRVIILGLPGQIPALDGALIRS